MAYHDPNYTYLLPFFQTGYSPPMATVLNSMNPGDFNSRVYTYAGVNPTYLPNIIKTIYGGCMPTVGLDWLILNQDNTLADNLLITNQPLGDFINDIKAYFGTTIYSAIMQLMYGSDGRFRQKYSLVF